MLLKSPKLQPVSSSAAWEPHVDSSRHTPLAVLLPEALHMTEPIINRQDATCISCDGTGRTERLQSGNLVVMSYKMS